MEDQFAEMRDHFLAALDRDGLAAQLQYAAEHCADLPDLRAKLEDMLRAHHQSEGFLASRSAASPTIDQPITEKPGTEIGPYKLLQQIGEGGMGVVYMAEQLEPIERRVALKIVRPGTDTRQVIARFEIERRALAMMDHPNIAKVLDAGTTETGRPYFVMELVRGVPITDYCDEHQLTPKQRLELFIPVCQAIQHAHQKGIIHRDLKPSNVLVALYDDKPVPKVIDFGVAKATSQELTEKTAFTQYGQIVGTLEYMSPEQAQLNQLDIDTRSDIYSLGVLLYELLTGSTPIDRNRLRAAAFEEMLRIIREEEPPKPSIRLSNIDTLPSVAANRKTEPRHLGAQVRGELDWVVMKALEKDRARRYDTASAFATDLQHFLHSEPVSAGPPTVIYRLRKFARRNMRALLLSCGLAMAVLTAIVAVAGSIGWIARDKAAQQTRAAEQVELILVEVDRLQDERLWPDALAAAQRAEPLSSLTAEDSHTRQRVRRVLEDIRLVLQLEDIWLHQQLVEPSMAEVMACDQAYQQTFAAAGLEIGELTRGAAADRLRQRSRITEELAAAVTNWSVMRKLVQLRTGEDTRWKELLIAADAIDPDPWRVRLRGLMRGGDANKMATLRQLAQSAPLSRLPSSTTVLISILLQNEVSPEEAASFLRRAQPYLADDLAINIELARAYSVSDPARPVEAVGYLRAALALRPKSSKVWNLLGWALLRQGNLDESVDCLRRSLRIDPKYAKAHHHLGMALEDRGQLSEAIASYREALRLEPNNVAALVNLGVALTKVGEAQEAITTYRRALGIDPNFAMAHYNLGSELWNVGEHEDAVAHMRTAVSLDDQNADALLSLGMFLASSNRREEAIGYLRAAVPLARDAETRAMVHSNLGVALVREGLQLEGIRELKEAAEFAPKQLDIRANLAMALELNECFAEALEQWRRVRELDPDKARGLNDLAWALATVKDEALRQPDEAVELARQAVAMEPDNWAYRDTLAVACYRAREWEEALLARKGKMDRTEGGDAGDFFWLAMIHKHLHHDEEARHCLDEAIRRMDMAPGNAWEQLRHEAESTLDTESIDGP